MRVSNVIQIMPCLGSSVPDAYAPSMHVADNPRSLQRIAVKALLVNNSYMRRVWTVQEVAMAKSIRMWPLKGRGQWYVCVHVDWRQSYDNYMNCITFGVCAVTIITFRLYNSIIADKLSSYQPIYLVDWPDFNCWEYVPAHHRLEITTSFAEDKLLDSYNDGHYAELIVRCDTGIP